MMNKKKYQYAIEWTNQFAGVAKGDKYSDIKWASGITPIKETSLVEVYENNKRLHYLWVEFLKERDKRLKETDWWAVQDRVMSEEQKTYRQQLRELPDIIDPLDGEINWPEKP